MVIARSETPSIHSVCRFNPQSRTLTPCANTDGASFVTQAEIGSARLLLITVADLRRESDYYTLLLISGAVSHRVALAANELGLASTLVAGLLHESVVSAANLDWGTEAPLIGVAVGCRQV